MAQAIQLDLIRMDGGTQPRQGIDWEVAYEYGDLMADGVKLPPVTVFYDGSEYWLADGFHRVHAAFSQEIAEIQAEVIQGTLEDAQWYSFGANKSHGLMRSNDDKQRAVQAALRHPKCVGLSNVQIARHVGVSRQTVDGWRKKLEASCQVSKIDKRTVTRNGTTYQQNTANIGKQSSTQSSTAPAQPAPAPQRVEPQAQPAPQYQPEPESSDSHDLEVFRLHLLGIIETPLTARLLADEITNSPNASETIELIRRAHEFLTSIKA
jgi:transposase-like protein